jgi:Pyridoxamine 5'-phosphate oxidase
MASRRDQIRMTDEEVDAFLGAQRVLVCATNGREGWPHLMPLWYVVRDTQRPSGAGTGGELWSWTFAKSQKVRNIERDARATVQVESGESYEQLRGVMFECEIVLHRDVEDVTNLGLEIFTRYAGGNSEPAAELADGVRDMVKGQAAKRVGLQFVERSRSTWDHRKLGGVY